MHPSIIISSHLRILAIIFIVCYSQTIGCQISAYQHRHYSENDGLLTDKIDDIISDENGILYFATEKGIVRFDSYRFSSIYIPAPETVIGELRFIKNKKNPIYIQGYGDLLGRIYERSVKFEIGKSIPFKNTTSALDCPSNFTFPASTSVTDIISRDGKRIIATTNGLYISNCSDTLSARQLIPGLHISAVHMDRESILWIAVKDNGVYALPTQYGQTIKLISDTSSVKIQMEHSETNIAPIILIEELRINGISRVDSTHLLDQLWHYENDLSIHFRAISNRKQFTGTPYYTYYLIRNSNDTIIDHTDELSVSYTNLQHGKYQFYVKAGNDSEIKGTSHILQFRILPHVFQTSFFYILTAIIIGLLAYLLIQYRINLIKKKEKEKTSLKEAQLGAIRSQLNPHFIFNSLNSIQNYIFKNDPEMASEYLSKFSRLMRKSLEFTRLDKISLAEEIEFLETYIELEKMRKNDGFNYSIHVDKKINPSNIMVNPLLSQPIIENSIKHAFSDMDKIGKLDISYTLEGKNMLSMSIKDNGKGIKYSTKSFEDHQSVGMQLIRDRIELINLDHKGVPAQMDIASGTNGTEVVIHLPIDPLI